MNINIKDHFPEGTDDATITRELEQSEGIHMYVNSLKMHIDTLELEMERKKEDLQLAMEFLKRRTTPTNNVKSMRHLLAVNSIGETEAVLDMVHQGTFRNWYIKQVNENPSFPDFAPIDVPVRSSTLEESTQPIIQIRIKNYYEGNKD